MLAGNKVMILVVIIGIGCDGIVVRRHDEMIYDDDVVANQNTDESSLMSAPQNQSDLPTGHHLLVTV